MLGLLNIEDILFIPSVVREAFVVAKPTLTLLSFPGIHSNSIRKSPPLYPTRPRTASVEPSSEPRIALQIIN